MIQPVIIAGGSGTRLWPLSRSAFPKQFQRLDGDLSMLQQTVRRLEGLSDNPPLVVCNEEHRFIAAEQMRQMEKDTRIILEPEGRNTAAAIALAAIQLLSNSDPAEKPPLMLVQAADHIIEDAAAFRDAVTSLLPAVMGGKFGVLGIVPTEAATGYGYIKPQTTEPLSEVQCFVEKPDAETAGLYLQQGYLWNSGMFVMRADRYLEALAEYRPDILCACKKAMAGAQTDLDFIRVERHAFNACPSESVDYAVMEPLSAQGEIVVAGLKAGWSDIGSWSALAQLAGKDAQGNSVSGSGSQQQCILKETQNTFVFTDQRLIATLGVKDLVIVDSRDALLIAAKHKSQDVKEIVAEIKQQGLKNPLRTEHDYHREVYRPWGKYERIVSSANMSEQAAESVDQTSGMQYLVKKITVNPGEKLSLQMHHHRAEHWVVVRGCAKVTNGEKSYQVNENESTYIPIGQRHALENPGTTPLEMIEIQTGDYLSEEDIVRFQDNYGRV